MSQKKNSPSGKTDLAEKSATDPSALEEENAHAAFQDPLKDKVIDAALECAANRGWNECRIRDIVERAGVRLQDFYTRFDDKSGILCAYGRRLDLRVVANMGPVDADMPVRDQLFDLLMERFDVLQDDREAVTSILHAMRLDPKQALISLPHLGRSMSWMLESAGISTQGARGALRVLGLTGVYLSALRVWLEDDSQDMGKTMATLDKSLNRADSLASSMRL